MLFISATRHFRRGRRKARASVISSYPPRPPSRLMLVLRARGFDSNGPRDGSEPPLHTARFAGLSSKWEAVVEPGAAGLHLTARSLVRAVCGPTRDADAVFALYLLSPDLGKPGVE